MVSDLPGVSAWSLPFGGRSPKVWFVRMAADTVMERETGVWMAPREATMMEGLGCGREKSKLPGGAARTLGEEVGLEWRRHVLALLFHKLFGLHSSRLTPWCEWHALRKVSIQPSPPHGASAAGGRWGWSLWSRQGPCLVAGLWGTVTLHGRLPSAAFAGSEHSEKEVTFCGPFV